MNVDDVTVLTVSFDPQWMEISYVEHDQVGKRVRQVHSIQVDPTLVAELHADVLDSLRDIVSAGLVEARNPPESFTAPR